MPMGWPGLFDDEDDKGGKEELKKDDKDEEGLLFEDDYGIFNQDNKENHVLKGLFEEDNDEKQEQLEETNLEIIFHQHWPLK
jgi:hypothetical protein